MNLSFDHIFEHEIPLGDFVLNWRFTDERYNKLPDEHLEQLKPLDKAAAQFLWDYISGKNLHADFPFKKDLFHNIDKTIVSIGNQTSIKEWLCQRGLAPDKKVFLSWDKENAMTIPWKLLTEYFDSFYYPSSDDLTVIDQSLNWALLFYHQDEIYFGSKEDFKTSP
jgi:hypothetical protein